MARKITPQEACAFCDTSPCKCETTDRRRKPKQTRVAGDSQETPPDGTD